MSQIDRITGLTGSIAIKAPCRIATNANISLSGALTIGSVVVADDDRVFVGMSQSNGVDRGIWIASTHGAWKRAQDFDGARDATHGTLIPVYLTSTGAEVSRFYKLTTDSPVIGTTSLTFVQEDLDATQLAADIASSIGASLFGVSDNGGFYDTSTVEDVMQEVGPSVSKNLLVNGSCTAARTTASQALTNGFLQSPVDGWFVIQNTAANGIAAQTTSTVSGFPKALKIGRTAADSATNSIITQQAVGTPDSEPHAGATVEFSFYAKAGANFSGANVNVAVFSGTGTDEGIAMSGWTGAATIVATTQVITASWVKYSFTGSAPAGCKELGVRLYYTPVGVAGADDNLYLTGLKLRAKRPNADRRMFADELLMARPRIPTCGRLSNLIDAGGPLGAADPFIKCHLIPYNGNQILINGRVEIIPDGALAASGGIIASYASCYVNKVAAQTLADNTFYFIYVFMLNGVPTITFSTTGYLQNGVAYGNAVKSDDPTCTLIGICRIHYVGGVPTTYGGARGQTVSSYFNQFRATLETNVAGPVTSVTAVQLPDTSTLSNGQPNYNFLEWVQFYDCAPRTKLCANVGVSSSGATAALGIGTNSKTVISGFTAKCVVPSVADNTCHLTVLSDPTDATGYYYAQVLGYSSAGTLQADGRLLADGVMV